MGNNAEKTRGRPFAKGNPGRPKGARHKATQAVEAMMEGEASALTRKAIDLALGGDTIALRLCLDRIAPPRKGRRVSIDMGGGVGAAGLMSAAFATLNAVGRGDISAEEASAIVNVLNAVGDAYERHNLEKRILALEEEPGTLQRDRMENCDET